MANPGTIEDTEWNGIQDTIAKVLGAPDASTVNLGYNAANLITSAQVSNNAKIYKEEWNTLRADVNVAFTHQTGSNSALVTKTGSDIIYSSDFTLIANAISTANTNRQTVDAGTQLTSLAGPSYSTTSAWSTRVTYNGTINFGTNAKFRGFWNGGGYVTFSASRAGGSSTTQNTSWTNLLAAMGTIKLTAYSMSQVGSTQAGTFANSGNLGVYGGNLPTGWVFSITDADANYTSNYYQVYLSFNTANPLTATIMYIAAAVEDVHAPIGSGPDYVDGTTALNCNIYYPFANSATTSVDSSTVS